MFTTFKLHRPGSTADLSGIDSTPPTDGKGTTWDSCTHGSTQQSDIVTSVESNLLYLHVYIGSKPLTALLDSGSTINVVSHTCYQFIPSSEKQNFVPCSDRIILANGDFVQIDGTALVRISNSSTEKGQFVMVYIISNATHPLILGTQYMKANNIVLDFNKCSHISHCKKTTKVKCATSVCVEPNSECLVTGVLSDSIHVGMQGVCSAHSEAIFKGLLVSKALVTCQPNHIVTIKVLNPGNEPVYLQKGCYLAKFELCDNSFDITPIEICARMSVHDKNDVHDCDRLFSSTSPVGRMSEKLCSSSVESTTDFEDFCSNFTDSPDLSPSEQNLLYQTLYQHKNVFTTKSNPSMGFTRVLEHHICLKPDAVSKHQRPYRLSPDKKEVLRHQLDELLRQGIIAPVGDNEDIPITSPIVLVSKRNKPKLDPDNITKEQSLSSYRFCVDFRYLNTQTQDFRYTIPDLQELTESFSECTPTYMSFIDMSSGFFQIGLSSDSAKYTAFNTCFGTFKFLRLPMGLRQSPNFFQLLMDKILKGLTFVSVLCYLDDICICSATFDKHLQDIAEVLGRLEEAGLKLGPSKCVFGVQSGVFLGHEISSNGIRPPPDKIEIIQNYPVPCTKKELQRVMGLFNWFRKYIPNYSVIANPLYQLLKQGVPFIWSHICQESFDKLKSLVVNSEALAFPRFDLEFRLAVDTCSLGIGYMLYQVHENGEKRIVRFGSKGLLKWQRSYGPTKLELLGMVTSILDCASYLRGHHFLVECDHQALRPLFQKQLKGAIYERWLAILQQFDFDIVYKPASQMVVPDVLSRNPVYPEHLESSPAEDDDFFPYVSEPVKAIRYVTADEGLQHLVNKVDILRQDNDCLYDADTEDDILPVAGSRLLKDKKFIHRMRTKPLVQDINNPFIESNLTKEHSNLVHSDAVISPVCENSDSQSSDGDSDTNRRDFDSDNRHAYLDNRDSDSDTSNNAKPTSDNDKNYGLKPTVDEFTCSGFSDVTVLPQIDSDSHINVTPRSEIVIPIISDSDSCTGSQDKTLEPVSEHTDVGVNSSSADTQSDVPIQHPERSTSTSSPVCHDTDTEIDSACTDVTQSLETMQDDNQSVSKTKHQAFIDLSITHDYIRQCQEKDSSLKPIIDYLASQVLPESQRESRTLLLKHSDYILLDGLLFHSRVAKAKRSNLMTHFQLVLPKMLVTTVLKLYHDSPLGGHGGIQDTLDRVKEHYYCERLADIVTDYVKSCHACQSRKITKVHSKNCIVAYPTPQAPFSVWQIDLYGPLPCTARGNTYLFTSVDMFSKFLYTTPLANKDAITVAEALFNLFCQYGTCDTLISDQGSEFTAKVVGELCRMLDIPQQFTPAFVHHCLGACERTHGTLASRLTPFLTTHVNTWDTIVPAIVFSMNNAVNASMGYSPFEILYAQRPKFPLTPIVSDLHAIPRDYHVYLKQKQTVLETIRTDVSDHIQVAQARMSDNVNAKTSNIQLSVGDYVYMTNEQAVTAKKLKNHYVGPYVVHSLPSPHMVVLLDPNTHQVLPNAVHIDRLKIACIRVPTPDNFFTVTNRTSPVTLNDKAVQTLEPIVLDVTTPVPQSVENKQAPPQSSRPKRTITKPARFDDFVDPDSVSSDGGFHKVKRVLAQRKTKSGTEYLVQVVGEPAHNAMWVSSSNLNKKALKAIELKPPPMV